MISLRNIFYDNIKFYEFRRRAAAVLYPNRCPFCLKLIRCADYYCGLCRRYLPYFYGKPELPENVSRLIAVCWYSRRVRDAVFSLKYQGFIYPADAFALMMSEKLLRDMNITDEADVLVPVPSGFLSVMKRGFSPARVICRRVAHRLKIPMADAVGAVGDKTEQKALSSKRRRENAMRSFYVRNNADITGKRVLLIDDVCTTGSTLSAIAEKLLDAGAKDVSACVFAHAVRYTHTDSGITRIKIGNRCRIPFNNGLSTDKNDRRGK